MNIEILKEVGFEEKEAKIYLALLKIGVSPASKIGEDLGYDRTTTYYTLLRMADRGYAIYTIKNGVRYFHPVDPEKILSRIKECENAFSKIIPELKKINIAGYSDLLVDVYKGKEGLNMLYRDIINEGKELVSFGVDEEAFMEYDLVHFKRYINEVNKGKLTERLLTWKGATKFGSLKSQYRCIPKEYFSPAPIAVYGNKIAMVVWEPTLHIVLIENKVLSDSFRKHFELLWKIAKPVNKK